MGIKRLIKKNCIFCKIAKGEIPAAKVWEDKDFLAFLDIRPINPGHTIVIPKEHFENIFLIPEELLTKYIVLIKKLGPKIQKAMKARWINLFVFGEEIEHAHIHIVPRFDNDGFKYPKQNKYRKGEELIIAKKIHSYIRKD